MTRVTQKHIGKSGLIKSGTLEVRGMVNDVLVPFPGEDDEGKPNQFDFATAGVNLTLNIDEWEFSAHQFAITPGWYSDTTTPIEQGNAPWYVDSNQVAHSFFIKKDGTAEKVSLPLTGRPDLIETLLPLAQQ